MLFSVINKSEASKSVKINLEKISLDDDFVERAKVEQCEDESIKNGAWSSIECEDFADIYSEASIVDLIHFLQIDSESSQLERENSHFVIAEITISANELVKNYRFEDAEDESEKANTLFSDSILITRAESSLNKEVFLSSESQETRFLDSSIMVNNLYETSPHQNNLSDLKLEKLSLSNGILSRESSMKNNETPTAESIAFNLINFFHEKKFSEIPETKKIPNLRQIEIFMQLLEVDEICQEFYEDYKNLHRLNLKPSQTWFLKIKSASFKAALKNSIDNLSSQQTDQSPQISQFKKVKKFFEQFSLSNQSNETNNNTVSLLLEKYESMNARIIGDEYWAPVRDQLILNLAPKPNRDEQMELQNLRCADCGIPVKRDKIKTFNYCEYFGKYFCRCCHVNSQSYIPARIVYQSDYRVTYEVCKKAKNFLEKIYHEPVITLESLNPELFYDSSIFYKVKQLRLKLTNCRSYVNTCRFAAELRRNLYQQIDLFLIDDAQTYSIQTLFKLKNTNFFERLKFAVGQVVQHIRKCELCRQQGYICGVCGENELIYPFELEKVIKCPNCFSCYHKKCFNEKQQCSTCKRKQTRQKIRSDESSAVNV